MLAGKKCFSSQGSGDKRHPHAIVLLDENTDETTVWPDPSLGLFGPKDVRMPLPGNVGISQRLTPPASSKPSMPNLSQQKSPWQPDLEVLVGLTNYERHLQVLKQSTQEDLDELNEAEIEELLLDLPQPSDVLECVAQDCPKLVRKGTSIHYPELFNNHMGIFAFFNRFCRSLSWSRCHIWTSNCCYIDPKNKKRYERMERRC